MDEHNVHHFWGISPAVDLLSVAEAAGVARGAPEPSAQPLNILQAASYDPRHSIVSLCRLHRHQHGNSGPINLYVYEEEPEVLLRHILLLYVLLDGSLLAKERKEMLLELHSNVLLRDQTAAYLDEKSKVLESLLVNWSASKAAAALRPDAATNGGKDQITTALSQLSVQDGASAAQQDAAVAAPPAEEVLTALLDLSLLKFQDKDRLVEALQHYRTKTAYDMVQAWDTRARKFYGDRYDARRNMIDWDYHMPLTQAGTPGQAPEQGSIIHYHHFRHWRLHGVAYELRDQRYNQPNRSMLSTAYGRTKEFKDRNGKDVGRSVSVWGYWGDILNSPYHCWGTQCEQDAFYKFSNKQWTRTAMDVAEYNVMALIHELRTGTRSNKSDSSEAHRARAARGPTSLADLQEESERTQKAKEEQQRLQSQSHTQSHTQSQNKPASAPLQAIIEDESEPHESDKIKAVTGGMETVETVGDSGAAEGVSAAAESSRQGTDAGVGGTEGVCTSVAEAGAKQQGRVYNGDALGKAHDDTGSTGSSSSSEGDFQPSVTFQGPRPGFMYKRGPQGLGYYRDTRNTQTSTQGEQGSKPAGSQGADARVQQGVVQQGEGSAASASAMQGGGEGGALDAAGAAHEHAARVRAAEAALDAAAARRLLASGVRVIPVLGGGGSAGAQRGASAAVSDLAKLLTGRDKYKGAFHVLSVGHRHVHLLNPEDKLAQAACDKAVLLVEGAKHLLQLKGEHVGAFTKKVEEMAAAGGWGPAPERVVSELRTPPKGASAGMAVTDAHLLFTRAV